MCAAKKTKICKTSSLDTENVEQDKKSISTFKASDQQKLYELVGQVHCHTGGETLSFAVAEGILYLNDPDLKQRIISILDILLSGWKGSFEKEFRLCCNRADDVEDYWCKAKDYGLPAEQYCTGCSKYYCQQCWQQSRHDKTATCPFRDNKKDHVRSDKEEEAQKDGNLSNISQED